ncbi:MAG: NADH-quinone oxidoreductase subunit J [Negativicutes bacterium]|nr:NADH-quinone oxidoreductase subunit J [Negativicutes bacterium]
MSNEAVYGIMFYLVSAVVLLSAVAAVTLRNLIHAALFLAISFVSVAGIYVLLHADFLAAVQVLIYGGAIPVLIAFGVMLTRTPGAAGSNPVNTKTYIWGLGITGALFAVIMLSLLKSKFAMQGLISKEPSIEGLARLMLGDFLIPFEFAAILLLAAMIGAIILARGGEAK